MAKKTNPIQHYITASNVLEVVSAEAKKNSVTLICRSKPGKEKEWIDQMEKLLLAFRDVETCDIHFCRRYLLKGEKMVYAWFIEIKGNLTTAQGVFNNQTAPEWTKQQPNKRKAAAGEGLSVPPKDILKGLKPRSPSPSGPDPLPPKGVKMGITKTNIGVGEKGEQYYEEVMVLPHSYKQPEAKTRDHKGARKL